MATINSINSNIPIELSKGGTNATTMANNYGVAYYDGTRVVTTAVGSSGQILTSNGSGSAPTFQTRAGSLHLIQSQAATGASLTFTTSVTGYNNYLLVWNNYLSASTSTLILRISSDGGSTWINTGYLSGVMTQAYNATTLANTNLTTGILLTQSVNSTTARNGYCWINNVGTTIKPSFMVHSRTNSSTPTSVQVFGGGEYGTTITINGFQVIPSTGNLTSGTFTLYGIDNS